MGKRINNFISQELNWINRRLSQWLSEKVKHRSQHALKVSARETETIKNDIMDDGMPAPNWASGCLAGKLLTKASLDLILPIDLQM